MIRFFIVIAFLVFTSACSSKIARLTSAAPNIRIKHHGKIISVNLDKYVAAVLAGEVHESWPMEALKAQAIAARTFALVRMKERETRPFHTESSVMDQVFKHHTSKKLLDAARETQGIVLVYKGALAETSFHSTCGGRTTDSKSVWGRAYDYLKSVPCEYCSHSPTFRWKQSIGIGEIEEKLKQRVSGLRITSKGPDGRALKIALGGKGSKELSAQDLRMALGPMRVKSTMLTELTMEKNNLTIAGQGFGHGVGMCQYGALGMAKQGKNMRDILYHYYPGTTLSKLY